MTVVVLWFKLFFFFNLQGFQICQIAKDTVWKVVDIVSCQIPNTHEQELEIQEHISSVLFFSFMEIAV